jgi:hypothetical protein
MRVEVKQWAMSLFDLFRRRPPIRDVDALAEFIDRNAAFLVQKGIYEYSRARAGHYSKVLFSEPGFLAAVELSRWRAYPLGLAMVGEVVDSVLAAHSAADRLAVLSALTQLALSVFDHYPIPAALGVPDWAAARAELEHRLQLVGLHPPKRAVDIPEPLAEIYFNLMPIHEKLRGPDFPTLRNYLRVTLCNIHDELTKHIDAPALMQALRAGQGVNQTAALTAVKPT